MFRHIVALILACCLAACGGQSATDATGVPERTPSTVPSATTLPTAAPAPASPAATTAPPPEPATATAEPPAPTPSPDPSHIAPAYTIDSDGVVSVWNLDTGLASAAVRLPQGFQHALAPDGTTLAFFGEDTVQIASLQSGDVMANTVPELQQNTSTITGLRWAPNSSGLYFDLEMLGAETPLPMIMYTDAISAQTRLLVNGAGPAPSPDGQLLAFAGAPFEYASPWGGGPGGVLTLALADGSQTRPVSGTTTFYPGWQPVVWSADNTYVAAGDSVVNVGDGTLAWKVPESDKQFLATITWLAPDGRSAIVWRTLRYTSPGQDDPGTFDEADEFAIVHDDGTEQLLVRSPGELCPCTPIAPTVWVAVAPNGQQALVSGSVENESNTGLWLIDLSQGQMQMVTNVDGVQQLPLAPLWSPDGRYALLGGGTHGIPETWAIAMDGSRPVHVGVGMPLGWAE